MSKKVHKKDDYCKHFQSGAVWPGQNPGAVEFPLLGRVFQVIGKAKFFHLPRFGTSLNVCMFSKIC